MSKENRPTTEIANPWADFDTAFDELHRQFATAVWATPWGLFVPDGAPARVRAARTDVTDTGAAYKVVIEVPGIPKEKLDIRVRGTSVEIRGEHSQVQETKGESYVHRERTFGGFYRALDLPEPVVAADATAKVDNGVLELELPKQKPTSPDGEVKVSVQ